MTRFLVLLVSFAIMLLGACAPLSTYYRPGAEVSRMQSDLLKCDVRALDSAPVATVWRQGPPRYIPSRRYCYNDGRCYYRGGYYIQGDIYSVDANRSLRNRVQNQCMADRGYQPVSIPACSQAVQNQVPVARMSVMPELTENSCAIKYRDGSWQVVTVAAR